MTIDNLNLIFKLAFNPKPFIDSCYPLLHCILLQLSYTKCFIYYYYYYYFWQTSTKSLASGIEDDCCGGVLLGE